MRILCVLCGFAVTSSLHAATTITETFTVNTTVPDNSDLGLADYRNISAPGLTEITSITVGLAFTGGWNGDLYAHLVHDSGFSVLLNRPGRTGGNPDGAGSSGMTINLSELAPSDVHTALPAKLDAEHHRHTGTTRRRSWSSCGRLAAPPLAAFRLLEEPYTVRLLLILRILGTCGPQVPTVQTRGCPFPRA